VSECSILATQKRASAVRSTTTSDTNSCDIAGLYLGRPGRVFALGTTENHSCREQLPPDLPMDTGIITLVDELTAAAPTPDWKSGIDDPGSSYREFLSKVDRNVPPDRYIHIVCLQCGPGMARATRGWISTHPRFFASSPATEYLWSDEIIRCLGKRRSRGIRPLTQELAETFRQWIGTDSGPDSVFTWVWRAARSVS
jgi:hypothetical protein